MGNDLMVSTLKLQADKNNNKNNVNTDSRALLLTDFETCVLNELTLTFIFFMQNKNSRSNQ